MGLTSREIHCTGQASKKEAEVAWLKTPEAEAIIWVCPGAPGATVTWFVATLYEGFTIGVVVSTVPLASVKVNGPTEAVMSVPSLSKALACKVSVWFWERHAQGLFG